MAFFPVFLDLDGRRCVVIGAGDVAARRARQLLKANADVLIIAPEAGAGITALVERNKIEFRQKAFCPTDLSGCVLVIAATDNEAVNQQVSDIARGRNIPVNVVDNPRLCSFIMPAVIDRDPVQIAISTGGASPVLARLLRAKLESLIPGSYGRLASAMGEFRERVRETFPAMGERRRFWEQVIEGPIAELFFAGRETAAIAALDKALAADHSPSNNRGEVYLVGGGPGDPDLLTFRALRLMQQADVVLYDRLVAPAVVALTRKDAEKIYVGKESDGHTVPQPELNSLLVKLAREGKRVLRLKGGDPFIFGRGGEEIEELAAAGVAFQVVPGITAASGCASYAGIPLTHRDHARSCVFVTGHLKEGKLDLNWEALLQPQQTIAIYMGVKGVDVLQDNLLQRGMNADTPVAIIQQGTTPGQKVYLGTVARLADIVRKEAIKPPSMMIIGDVVKLHEKLSWR